MTRATLAARCCHDCGATRAEAAFVGNRKPRGDEPDQCVDCAADPLAASIERVALRRAQIAALRAAGPYRAQKPIHTTPLFAGLRASAERDG